MKSTAQTEKPSATAEKSAQPEEWLQQMADCLQEHAFHPDLINKLFDGYAAAPELLEACRAALDSVGRDAGSDMTVGIVLKIQAAIAKAEGK